MIYIDKSTLFIYPLNFHYTKIDGNKSENTRKLNDSYSDFYELAVQLFCGKLFKLCRFAEEKLVSSGSIERNSSIITIKWKFIQIEIFLELSMFMFAIQMNFTTVATLPNRIVFDLRLEGTETIVNFTCVEIYAKFYWQTNVLFKIIKLWFSRNFQ